MSSKRKPQPTTKAVTAPIASSSLPVATTIPVPVSVPVADTSPLKVYLSPLPDQTQGDNGVGRVILAQNKYLPEHGIELVRSEAEADITAAHIFSEHVRDLDVLHLHGLYFTADAEFGPYGEAQHMTNTRILQGVRRARAITMPSEWAGEPFRRDMRLNPVTIPNGVETELWEPSGKFRSKGPEGFVLWNKNRTNDRVCDPGPAYELARRGVPVVSTFAPGNVAFPLPATLQLTGKVPFETMQDIVRQAGFYLATTKEVFSLSVLEAMASGVPILGYRWGGTADAVRHGVEGFLVQPGDIEGLVAGLEWLKANYEKVSRACVARAKQYEWREVVGQYAALYRKVWKQKQAEKQAGRERGKVAVVITNYNYGRYVGEAIDSVLAQTHPVDQIIVVDDGSTDDSRTLLRDYSTQHPNVRIIEQRNAGVANARNTGIDHARGTEYTVCLDADDRLDPAYISTLLPYLEANRALGVVWSKLAHMDEQGQLTGTIWDFDYSWENQADFTDGKVKNGIPAGAMFRRSMWERVGGYRQIYHPAEDAEFWLRGLSVGFLAQRVTEEALFHYRVHEGSASRTKRGAPIHAWYPWALDAQYPMAAPSARTPLIRSYSRPLVSVVIPVGPSHARYLPAALDSLLGQTFRDWEVIVVDDTDCDGVAQYRHQYPFMRLEQITGRKGAGFARNRGLEAVRTPLVLWLDADDFLAPTALEKMVRARGQHGPGPDKPCYHYTDWVRMEQGDKFFVHQTQEYSQQATLDRMQHAVTVLMRTEDARAVGGFDEKLLGWEDWDFFSKLAVRGICGHRVAEPLFTYRIATGQRREESLANQKELLATIRGRYSKPGGINIMACGCGAGPAPQLSPDSPAMAAHLASLGATPNSSGLVQLEFTGETVGSVSYRVNGHEYVGGNNPFDRYIEAQPGDVARLLAIGVWRLSGQSQPAALVS